MPKPLLSAESLIRSSWDQYLAKPKFHGRIVLSYLVVLGAVSLLLMLIPVTVFTDTIANRLILSLAITVPLLCVEIIVTKALLTESLKNSTNNLSHIIVGGLWVSILTYLALLGGMVLFIIPAIWLSVPLKFALINFLDEQGSGTAALKQSLAMVRNRWWSTLWRLVASSVIFVLLMLICYFIISLLVFLLLGNALNSNQSISSYLNSALLIIITAAFKPLFIIFVLNLYKNLKETA